MSPDPTDGGDDGPPNPTDAAPPAHVLFDLLAHPRRARTVSLLVDAPEHTTDVHALATELADTPGTDEADADARPSAHDLAISLVHGHLPRLADAGVVAHDAEDGTVRLLVDPDALVPFLDLLE